MSVRCATTVDTATRPNGPQCLASAASVAKMGSESMSVVAVTMLLATFQTIVQQGVVADVVQDLPDNGQSSMYLLLLSASVL